ncbi:MAG TPA: cell wall hydrolase [Burkholderiales bacterium]|nr:cell wall hydrolase [Burkholderiales bacterium]
MGWTRIAIALAMIAIIGEAAAADQAQKAQAAESKAVELEQRVATEGAKAPPAATPVITKPEAQAVDPAGTKPLDDPITCLSRTIYWEAKGEGVAGMEAIANVVMNRLGHGGFPETVCGVVTQGRERGACQFSWWCDGRPDDALDDKSYADAKEIARRALNRQLADRTHGALYFHHRKATPKWAAQYLKTAEIGEHFFYKPRMGAAK